MAGRHGIKMRSAALTAAMAACSDRGGVSMEYQVGAGLPGRLENERQPRGLGGDDGRRFGLSTVGPFTGGRLRVKIDDDTSRRSCSRDQKSWDARL